MEKITERMDGYQEFKQALDQELQKAAEGFVRIGFLLRLAMETDILRESGYRDVYEFAEREYSLDKSQVSRFIHINIKFSEDGHSDRLQGKYQGYGYAKLAVMLQLPETVLEELSPAYSKSEIQKIHEEIKEEKKTSDLEIWLENAEMQQEQEGTQQGGEEDSLSKVLRQLCHSDLELYRGLHRGYHTQKEGGRAARIFQEILAPAGEAIYSVRIQGIGRLMFSVKGVDQPVSVIHVRANEKETFSWSELVQAFAVSLYQDKPWEKSWEGIYGEQLPGKKGEEDHVVPVQHPEEKKPVSKKKPMVQTIKERPKPKPEPKEKRQERPEHPDSGFAEERQTSIETDFKEVLPEGYEISHIQAETETGHWESIASLVNRFNRELACPEGDRYPEELLKSTKEILAELETIIQIRRGDRMVPG